MSDSFPWSPGGLTWEEMREGLEFETMARTIRETDANLFISVAAFYEPLFMDVGYVESEELYDRSPVPGLLTLSIAEGLVILTGMLTDTGMALLSLSFQVSSPVMVGDTLQVRGKVTESRASSKGDHRGVVITQNQVVNQEGNTVMTYEPVRLIKGSKPGV